MWVAFLCLGIDGQPFSPVLSDARGESFGGHARLELGLCHMVQSEASTRGLVVPGSIGKVLLGSAEWVEKMRRVLGLSEADANVSELRHLTWRPSQEQIELAVAEEFGVERSELFIYQADQKQ